jgi:alpha-L-fucosidase
LIERARGVCDHENLVSFLQRGQSINSRPVPAWFEDAKFGIFIHWGLYSVPAYSPTAKDKIGTSERYAEHYWRWIETDPTQNGFKAFHNRVYGPNFKYQDFVSGFKAEMFQPDEWAARFKYAGAQYVVLTSKHHDGFTLWPSKLASNWNAVDIGPHRNLLGDLSSSVRKAGIKMGLYYSLLEWYHPLYKKATITNYVDKHMIRTAARRGQYRRRHALRGTQGGRGVGGKAARILG